MANGMRSVGVTHLGFRAPALNCGGHFGSHGLLYGKGSRAIKGIKKLSMAWLSLVTQLQVWVATAAGWEFWE